MVKKDKSFLALRLASLTLSTILVSFVNASEFCENQPERAPHEDQAQLKRPLATLPSSTRNHAPTQVSSHNS